MRGPGLLITAALALVACGGPNISTIRMGSLYPPKGDDCHVGFENLDYQRAMAAYEQLGLITVSGGDVTDQVREKVRQKACAMGADALSLNASVDTRSRIVGGMTQFLVLRKRADATATSAPPQTGI